MDPMRPTGRRCKVKPKPSEFPRAKLLWPLVAPVSVLAFALAAEGAGHAWNVHGDLIALILVFSAALLIGLISLLFALPQAIRMLLSYPSLRTASNLVATGLALAFVGVAMLLILYAFFKVTAS